MKKILSDDLTLYFNDIFPKVYNQPTNKKNIVYIGIGGNIGNTNKIFKKLILLLKHNTAFTILQTSPILKNPPFGYLEQNDFLNAIVVLKTDLSPKECLRLFQRYEKRFKRVKTFQDAPRTLDIDILYFNNLKIDTKLLTIPHKGVNKRQSVYIPMGYLKKC